MAPLYRCTGNKNNAAIRSPFKAKVTSGWASGYKGNQDAVIQFIKDSNNNPNHFMYLSSLRSNFDGETIGTVHAGSSIHIATTLYGSQYSEGYANFLIY